MTKSLDFSQVTDLPEYQEEEDSDTASSSKSVDQSDFTVMRFYFTSYFMLSIELNCIPNICITALEFILLIGNQTQLTNWVIVSLVRTETIENLNGTG